MKPITYGRPAPPSPLPRIVLMLGMLAVGGAGSVVLLYAGGVVDLPFLHGKTPEAKARPQGVAVPLSARPIPAYTQVLRDHILDAKTLDLVVAYFSPEEVEKNGFLTVDKVIGRVLAADKGAGYAFKEKDFLPPGTKPGMAAGVPSGKRSYVLDARQVDGVNDLKIGDHIDVLAAVMVEFDKTTRQYHTVPTSPNRNGGKKGEYGPGQTGIVAALAQDAIVVEPLTTRQVPDEGAAIPPQTGQPKMRVERDITIAIDPKEAAPLTEAVAVGGEIFCVAHTGLPNDLPGLTPGFQPLTPVQVVETIVGGKRDVKVFPDASGQAPPLSPWPEPTEKKAPSPVVPTGPSKVAEESTSEAPSEPRP